MSLVRAPGETFYPTVNWGATGAVLGVRVTRKTDGVDVVARTAVGVVESPALSELYTQAAGLVAPLTIGPLYMSVWDDTVDFVAEDLTVSTTGTADPGPGDTIYPSVNWGTTGETLGVSIRRKTDGAELVARTTVGVTEMFPGVYVAAGGVVVPLVEGALYEIVFDNTVDFTAEDLTVSTAAALPSGLDLCTLAQVKAYLQKTTTVHDSILQEKITEASTLLEDLMEREFAPRSSETRRLPIPVDRKKSRVVFLAPYDLRVPSVVVIHPESTSPVTLTRDAASQGYTLGPQGPRIMDTYRRITLSRDVLLTSDYATAYGSVLVDVTGTWGPDAVPGPVQHACVVTVGLWFRREIGDRGSGSADMDIDGLDLRPIAVPGSTLKMLEPYGRVKA